MKSRILFTSLIFLSLQGLAHGQEPESKPTSKPAPDKAKKLEDAAKKDSSPRKKVALELGALKEVKDFLARMNKAADDVLAGKNPTASFGTIGVEGESDEDTLKTWRALRAAGAHKLTLTTFQWKLEMGVGGGEGVFSKGFVVFDKGSVLFFPLKLNSYEKDFKPYGCATKDLPGELAILKVLGAAMKKKAKECKRSKNFPFVNDEDYELFTPLFKRPISREKWNSMLKSEVHNRRKLFVKLKSSDKVKMHYDIDSAIFLAKDKNGKGVGALIAEFNLRKKDVSIQFLDFRHGH
ncbi:MAG: hypothetical protein P1V97_14050 [Planctomycetota bacterium]|nr:hypothetical protein [Planctomycetota bacterium]